MLCYEFDSHAERTGIASLMRRLSDLGIAYKDLSTHQSSLEDIFVELVHRPRERSMNGHGIAAIYRFEMARWERTLWQSLITPVITTALYFVVFGSALGSRMTAMDGVSYGAFIVPGLTLALGVHAVDLQRQLRHLFSEVYGHDLRTCSQPRSRASRRSSPMSARRSPSR